MKQVQREIEEATTQKQVRQKARQLPRYYSNYALGLD